MTTSKKNMSCNKPQKSWRRGKKKVVKACSSGKERFIHFGATGYGNNYSTAARRSFRARHKCDTAKDKLTARYWACKNLWTKGGSVTKCPSNRKCKGSTRKSRKRKSVRKSRKRRKSVRKSRKSKSVRKSRKRKSVRKSRKRKSVRKSSKRKSVRKSSKRKSVRKSRKSRKSLK
jgi:hypothetical protein